MQGAMQMKDENKTNAPAAEIASAAPRPAPKPAPKPRDPYSDRRPEREPLFEADPWR